MRISQKQLEGAVEHLNMVTGNPVKPYKLNEETGRYEPQAKCYHLDIANGGYRLVQMSEREGCSGVRDITGRGTKREVFDQVHAIIKVLYVEGLTQ